MQKCSACVCVCVFEAHASRKYTSINDVLSEIICGARSIASLGDFFTRKPSKYLIWIVRVVGSAAYSSYTLVLRMICDEVVNSVQCSIYWKNAFHIFFFRMMVITYYVCCIRCGPICERLAHWILCLPKISACMPATSDACGSCEFRFCYTHIGKSSANSRILISFDENSVGLGTFNFEMIWWHRTSNRIDYVLCPLSILRFD